MTVLGGVASQLDGLDALREFLVEVAVGDALELHLLEGAVEALAHAPVLDVGEAVADVLALLRHLVAAPDDVGVQEVVPRLLVQLHDVPALDRQRAQLLPEGRLLLNQPPVPLVEPVDRHLLQQLLEEGEDFWFVLHAVGEVGDLVLEVHVALGADEGAHALEGVAALEEVELVEVAPWWREGGLGVGGRHDLVEAHLHAFGHVGVALLPGPHALLELQLLDVDVVEVDLQLEQVLEAVLVHQLLARLDGVDLGLGLGFGHRDRGGGDVGQAGVPLQRGVVGQDQALVRDQLLVEHQPMVKQQQNCRIGLNYASNPHSPNNQIS